MNMIHVCINGDSGDGIQLLGQLFTRDMARSGLLIHTEPNFPAEIRAPHGTQAGISGFKIVLADEADFPTEHTVDVLVALNPAGLAKQLAYLKEDGLLIINSNQFKERDFKKAQLDEATQALLKQKNAVQILNIPINELTLKALTPLGLSQSQMKQSRNMCVLGVLLYLFERDLADTQSYLSQALSQTLVKANELALKTGYEYLTVQEFSLGDLKLNTHSQKKGTYRQINGNQAFALGALSVVSQLKRPMLLAGYPITPASRLLELMQGYQENGITVFQAEDEMAACGAALGASYGGHLGLTCTSGPGFDLKMEMIGLAVMTEMPLVIINIQRAGPSTGMPTKTEQSDLLQAIYGRHGESPCVVLAAFSAVDCFYQIREAYEIALTFSLPVIILSDAALANSIEVWQVPEDLPKLDLEDEYLDPKLGPYQRSEKTFARKQFHLGGKAAIQCLGGLEKDPTTGHVSYSPTAHQTMSEIRLKKLDCIADREGGFYAENINTHEEILLLTWGSSFMPVKSAYAALKQAGYPVGLIRIDRLFPLPHGLAAILKRAKQILVFELNSGQLCQLLRAHYLVDAQPITQLNGSSFKTQDLLDRIKPYVEGDQHE